MIYLVIKIKLSILILRLLTPKNRLGTCFFSYFLAFLIWLRTADAKGFCSVADSHLRQQPSYTVGILVKNSSHSISTYNMRFWILMLNCQILN